MTKKAEIVKKEEEKQPNNEIEQAPQTSGEITIPQSADPQAIVDKATEAAQVLKKVVDARNLSVALGGVEPHLKFEAWQLIGAFNNSTAKTVSTRRILKGDKFYGYEAKAEVVRNGQVISAAEAMCAKDEPNWNTRTSKQGTVDVSEFQLRSMAQTRASAKALRNAFAWVAVLGGYNPTPYEDMTGTEKNAPQNTYRQPQAAPAPATKENCPKCGSELRKIPAGVSKKTGKPYDAFTGCSNRDCDYTRREA